LKRLVLLSILVPLLLALIGKAGFAQLPNFNMNLLANLNEHPTGERYSACWGYVAPDGREYALLGAYTGTAIVDITDSANISEVAFIPGIGSGWREMKTYSHYAYVVTDVNGNGMQIIDLQYLPDSARLITTYTFGFTKVHTISQEGPFLYLNGSNFPGSMGGTFVLDLTSSPVAPVVRGVWTNVTFDNTYVHDSRVLNDTIWAANIYSGRITVIDATDKNNMQTITFFQTLPIPFPHNCALTVDRDYLLTTDETDEPPGRLKIWDVRNLSNITFVTQWQPTGITTSIVHNVEVYGNFALIAHYTAGIRLVNITNPSVPVEAAWYDTRPSTNNNTFTGCWGVYMFPSGKIIGSDMQTGLYVVKPTIAVSSAGNVNNIIPEKFSLSQNYPNPFNPETNIKFSLPKNSFVSLKVFNIAGQQVAELLNDRRDAGEYSINFDASKYGLTSGVYFYRLDSENFSETKKMLLIK
jgi:choice-of-anchor B domain-containing protein